MVASIPECFSSLLAPEQYAAHAPLSSLMIECHFITLSGHLLACVRFENACAADSMEAAFGRHGISPCMVVLSFTNDIFFCMLHQ